MEQISLFVTDLGHSGNSIVLILLAYPCQPIAESVVNIVCVILIRIV